MDLNPKFVFHSPIHGRRLELAEHVDHAIIALDGRAPLGGETAIEPLAPVIADETSLRIDLWVEQLDDYTCTYGFLCSSEDGRIAHARGERSVVNLDPTTRRPVAWPTDFRSAHVELMKDLPAYA